MWTGESMGQYSESFAGTFKVIWRKIVRKKKLNRIYLGEIVFLTFLGSKKSNNWEFLIKIVTCEKEKERETKAGVCKVFTKCSSVGTLECTYLQRWCQVKSLHPETCFSAAYSGVSNIENAVLTDWQPARTREPTLRTQYKTFIILFYIGKFERNEMDMTMDDKDLTI